MKNPGNICVWAKKTTETVQYDLYHTVTVLIIRGDLCSRISRFKKKREIK